MGLTPGKCAAKTGLFGTADDHADLGIFKLDAFILQRFHQSDAHIAAGKVVVCAVNNSFIIHHAEKKKHERHADKAPKRAFLQSAVYAVKYVAAAYGDNGEYQIIKHTADTEENVDIKTHAAEHIVYRPFPCRVRVTVKEDTAFHFTFAALDGGNVMTGLFLKEKINEFLIKTELKYHGDNGKNQDQCGNKGCNKHHTDRNHAKNDIDGDPAVKRTGMLLKALNGHSVGAAILFKDLRHVLTGLLLPFAAGIALTEVFADIRDFFYDVISVFLLVINDRRQIHKHISFEKYILLYKNERRMSIKIL